MATELASGPSLVSPATIHHYPFGPTAPFTPMPSGSNTPANISPTSPRTEPPRFQHPHMPTRQLREPKKPLYVPAALRPTEKPVRQSPPKNADPGIDVDSLFGARRGTDASVEGVARLSTDEWIEEPALGPVTGPPSRNHWKPDHTTQLCDSLSCQKRFSWFCRRHHCRRCGGIFCAEHSSHEVKLNQHALFHPEGMSSRACDRCFNHYKQWEQRRNSQASNESSQASSARGIPSSINPQLTNAAILEGHKVGSFTGSVPRDWHWSTF